MKISVIGGGKMGSALIEGLVRIGTNDISVLSGHSHTTKNIAAKYQITPLTKLSDVKESNLIINAAPVNQSEKILSELGEITNIETTIISVAYGIDLNQLSQLTKRSKNLVYMIPNLPVAVQKGVMAVDFAPDDDFFESEVYAVLSQLGKVIQVKNNLMDVVSAGAGSAPAYVAMMIEALADGMVLHGLPRKAAYEVAEQMVEGTASLLLEKGMSPSELKDGVASPGGSTIRGVAALEEAGLRNAMIKAIDATIG